MSRVFKVDYIPDPDRGRPLWNAKIFVGVANQDPTIPSNQIQLTGDIGFPVGQSIPVPQPVRTNAGGITVYNNSPLDLNAPGQEYAIQIFDRNDNLIYNFPQVDGVVAMDTTSQEEVTGLIVHPDVGIATPGQTVDAGVTAFRAVLNGSSRLFTTDRPVVNSGLLNSIVINQEYGTGTADVDGDIYQLRDYTTQTQEEITGVDYVNVTQDQVDAGFDLFPLIGQGIRVAGVGLWVVPSVTADGSAMPNPALLDITPSGPNVTINGGTDVELTRTRQAGSVQEFSNVSYQVGDIVHAARYYGDGRIVDGLYYRVESPSVADGFKNHNDASGNLLRLFTNGPVDLLQCGGIPGEDITPALIAMDGDSSGVYKYTSNTDSDALLIDSHTFSNKFVLYCQGTGVHFKPINPSTNVFSLDAANSEVFGAVFDYVDVTETKNWTPVSFNAIGCKASITVKNLESTAGNEDTAVSGLKMRSAFGTATVYGENLINTNGGGGDENLSLPHLIDVQNNATNSTIEHAECRVGVAGVVCANSQTTIIKSLILTGMEDNGLYTLAGCSDCQVDQMYYEGNEEPVVDKGTRTYIDSLTIENQVFPIGIDDNGSPLQINSLKLLVSDEAKVKAAMSAVVQARNSNVSCAGINIDRVVGSTYGDRIFGFTTGSTSTVKIRNVDINHIYHDVSQGKAIVGHTAGFEVSYENWRLVISDETGTLTSSDAFTHQVPPGLTRYSTWSNVVVTCPDGDYVFRGLNCIQDEMVLTDATVQFVGPNVYVREVPATRAGQKRVYSTAIPTVGSWLRGDEVIRPNPVAGGTRGWVAVADIPDASVDNSDFKEFGDIQA